jgi:hypothetical protein
MPEEVFELDDQYMNYIKNKQKYFLDGTKRMPY